MPVAVGRARFEAGRALLAAHPEVDLIVSDDGLQHVALARDVEIAVIGARGLGNGWVLPAGPLREPPSRLDTVDAIVLNTANEAVVESRTPRFAASSCFATCTQLSTGKTALIDELAEKIHAEHLKPLSAAGIAAPGRFFAMIRALTSRGPNLSSATISTLPKIPSPGARKTSSSSRERMPSNAVTRPRSHATTGSGSSASK